MNGFDFCLTTKTSLLVHFWDFLGLPDTYGEKGLRHFWHLHYLRHVLLENCFVMVTCFIKGDSALYVLYLSNYMSLKNRLQISLQQNYLHQRQNALKLQRNSIPFASDSILFYKFAYRLPIHVKFVSNSLQIRFTLASNSLHTCFKFRKQSFTCFE